MIANKIKQDLANQNIKTKYDKVCVGSLAVVLFLLGGSLRNEDGNGNENVRNITSRFCNSFAII